MNVKMLFSCVIMGLACGQISQAAQQQSISIDLNNVQVQGHQQVDIRKMLTALAPQVDAKQAHLQSVEVLAKAKTSGASASLIVAGTTMQTVAIPVGDFADLSEQSFSKVKLANNAESRGQQWVLVLHGNIMIDKAIVTLVTVSGQNLTEVEVSSEEAELLPPPFPPYPPRPNDDWRRRNEDDWRRRPREIVVHCSSDRYRPASCYVGRNAQYAYVRRQLSFASCRQVYDWWLDRRNDTIHVRNGCRAEFGVVLNRGWGRF